MPKSLESLLDQAKKNEEKYDWTKAAGLYEQALGIIGKTDFLKKGEIQEKIGHCLYRRAFQADSQEEFKEGMQRAVEVHEKAHGLFDKLAGEQKSARTFRCDAMIAYMGYWLAIEAPEKKRLIGRCWTLTKEALKAFKDAGDAIEYGETYNELSPSAFLAYVFEWDFQAGKKIISEAMESGEQAITLLSSVGESNALARAYVKAAFYVTAFGLYFIPDLDERERHRQKGQGYWRKACELSEEAALLELSRTPGSSGEEFGWNTDEMIVYFEKALGHARKTKDKYMIGTALDWLTYATAGKALGVDDPEKRAEALQRAFQCAKDAKQHFSSISFVSPRNDAAWTGAPQAPYYHFLGFWETNQRKKRDLLEKAVMYGAQALKQAESTGYPRIIFYVHHELSASLERLAQVEADLEEKRRLLEKALEHRKECVRVFEPYGPFEYWNLGLQRWVLARVKARLSRFEEDSEKRENMLEEAIASAEQGLRLSIKEVSYREKRGELALFFVLGLSQYYYGELLIHLYGLTSKSKHQRKAIKAFEEAAESYQKINMFSREAECRWKIAGSYDALGEHLKAGENFTLASTNYVSAAENIPQLEDFYRDHACYMEAWSEIEKARHYHKRQEYGKAKEYYEKSAGLHKSTERWSYLSDNYLAWARLEEAEDLSRTEETQGARDLFQQASNLFVEAKKSIQTKLEETETEEEKELLVNLAKASVIRHDYSIGRIALEEARILDRQGDHAGSSRKYGFATERFQKITDAFEHESDRKEVRPIVDLCQAWEMMTRAEAEASPDLYLEASKHFEEAKDHSLDEKSRILALGHSSFCKALEAGTEFEVTRDMKVYSTAKKHLEAAENYYLKAGFKTASEYAKATYMLFDAYVYTNKAQTETDPRKKAQYYQMAEKLLQASASSYTKAKHPEKSEEIQRLLESVKEKRQLAMSLAEVLTAPIIASTTTSFSTPAPTHEKAVGLERFEHAVIEGRLTASREVTVGGEVEVRLDLVNVAKEPGLLVRIDNMVPPGLEVAASSSQYIIERGSIDMKGRRLGPLKVETVKLDLRPTKSGVFNLCPQVIYVNEAGQFKTCKPEPASVTVHPKLAFEFSTKAAEKAFNFLVNSFAEDYMRRRLPLEKSGWRTLMQIVKHAKVSKSSVYGTGGRRGRAVSELERRGLVETRVFPGERGRGGKILKMRISYDKETVKRHIDQQVMKIKEK